MAAPFSEQPSGMGRAPASSGLNARWDGPMMTSASSRTSSSSTLESSASSWRDDSLSGLVEEATGLLSEAQDFAEEEASHPGTSSRALQASSRALLAFAACGRGAEPTDMGFARSVGIWAPSSRWARPRIDSSSPRLMTRSPGWPGAERGAAADLFAATARGSSHAASVLCHRDSVRSVRSRMDLGTSTQNSPATSNFVVGSHKKSSLALTAPAPACGSPFCKSCRASQGKRC
mmetsp:Transcript_105616/g.308853  ORF Transcript_105616/g.308853 Transcript_105616/m.308853 type:complete len:233 (-) Transcript_105616:169-867(-)